MDILHKQKIAHMTSPAFRDRAVSLMGHEEYGPLFLLTENDLWRELRARKKMPTTNDNILRSSFWFEYNRTVCSGENKIHMDAVTGTVIMSETFYSSYIIYPEKVIWLFCPPVSYENRLNEALSYSLRRLRDLLEDQPANEINKILRISSLIFRLSNGEGLTLEPTRKSAVKNIAADLLDANVVDIDEEIEKARKQLEKSRQEVDGLSGATQA